MNRKLTSIALFAGLTLLIIGAYFLSNVITDTFFPDESSESTAVYDFLAEDADSNPVYLSDFLDRPAIVYFWTSWCSWCTRGMDELERFYEATDRDIQILAVNLSHLGNRQDEVERGRAFMEAQDFSFASLYDTQGEAQATYGISGVPMTLFIDRDGYIIHSQLGFLDLDGLQHFAEMLS